LRGRSLENEATAGGALLHKGDLPGARLRLTHLVSRDTSSLNEAQVARAVVESVAENTSDAVVAPLFWGAVAGVPGLIGYRAANTLDAMVGYRNDRYENFGWASARFDDLVNWPAARLGGLLVAVASPRTALRALAAWRRDASGHPSPNAGVVESSFAGALGIRLGGTNRYGDRVEHRVVLGDGRAPEVSDVARANELARRVGFLAALTTAIAALKMRSK
ncbi:MAG: adenosylcobinamide-phosphate synthase CbiB, partial [Marmoricola sp.]